MAEHGTGSTALSKEVVSLTGRLASMTRAEAAQLVVACGGVYSAALTPKATLLVIGQEGLPLRKNGALSRKLAKAQELVAGGARLRIWSEQQLLQRLGLEAGHDGVHRLYTAAQLASLLGIAPARLRSWIRWGLISPIESSYSIGYFDYSQVSVAKNLAELTRRGVGIERIRRSLRQLSRWIQDVEQPLAQLRILEENGLLLVRSRQGLLAEPTGQMRLDLEDEGAEALQLAQSPRTPEEWFDRGCELESADQWEEAAAAYRQALLAGTPSAETCFNLANVLYALGHKGQSSERYRQAVETDPTFVEAWNNLGVVLAELKQCEQAVWAYRRAIAVDPHYTDTHFNLAECLEQNGCLDDAREHWQQYLRADPASQWGQYAQRRLRECGRGSRGARDRKNRESGSP